MYKKILVPMALDHDISPQTLKLARTLCDPDGMIMALHVYEAPEGTASAYVDEDVVKKAYEHAREKIAEKVAAHADVQAEVVTGHSARSIIDYAATHGVDCIVMGSHKPDLSDYFLGSTAARVVRHAPCAVHVHRSS